MSFFFLYVVLLPVFALFLVKRKKYHYLFFALITVLSMIRYDTVSDYLNYVINFNDLRMYGIAYRENLELGFIWLNKFFAFSQWGFIPLIALCTLFAYREMYKWFKQYDVVLLGAVLFLFMSKIYLYENIIRQLVAIAFFLYAVKFVNKKEWWKYLLCMLCAILFHNSAYILILLFFLIILARNIQPPKVLSGILLLVFIVLLYSGVWENLFYRVIPSIMYYDKFADITAQQDVSNRNYFTLSLRSVIAWLPCLFLNANNAKEKMVINLSWIYSLMFLILSPLPNISRAIEYIAVFQIIAIAWMIKKISAINVRYFALSSFIMLFFFIANTRQVMRYYTDGIYKTVFSNSCAKHEFYVRDSNALHTNEKVDRNKTKILKPR